MSLMSEQVFSSDKFSSVYETDANYHYLGPAPKSVIQFFREFVKLFDDVADAINSLLRMRAKIRYKYKFVDNEPVSRAYLRLRTGDDPQKLNIALENLSRYAYFSKFKSASDAIEELLMSLLTQWEKKFEENKLDPRVENFIEMYVKSVYRKKMESNMQVNKQQGVQSTFEITSLPERQDLVDVTFKNETLAPHENKIDTEPMTQAAYAKNNTQSAAGNSANSKANPVCKLIDLNKIELIETISFQEFKKFLFDQKGNGSKKADFEKTKTLEIQIVKDQKRGETSKLEVDSKHNSKLSVLNISKSKDKPNNSQRIQLEMRC